MDSPWPCRAMEVVSRVTGICGGGLFWPAGFPPHTSGLGVMVHTGKVDDHKLGSY